MKNDQEVLSLIITQEESLELAHIISKILRFGFENYHPKTKIKNVDLLEEEIGDLLACIKILESMNIVNSERVHLYSEKKIEKLKVYQPEIFNKKG